MKKLMDVDKAKEYAKIEAGWQIIVSVYRFGIQTWVYVGMYFTQAPSVLQNFTAAPSEPKKDKLKIVRTYAAAKYSRFYI